MKLAAAIALWLLATGSGWAAPGRIVSLNLCTDHLLFALADKPQIAALSRLARDPRLSHIAREAEGLPSTSGGAEDVLTFHPDLILAGSFGAEAAVRLVQRLGRAEVVRLPIPHSLDDIRAQVALVAGKIGQEQRGEALLANMEAKLAGLARPGPERATALIYQPNGFTAGAGTLVDDVLQAAGFRNYGAEVGLRGYGFLSLERVVSRPPDLLVLPADQAAAPSQADRLLQHPALGRTARLVKRMAGPPVSCGGPFTVDAVVQFAGWRAEAVSR